MSAISLRTPEFITFTSLDASGLGHGGSPGLVTWSAQTAQRRTGWTWIRSRRYAKRCFDRAGWKGESLERHQMDALRAPDSGLID